MAMLLASVIFMFASLLVVHVAAERALIARSIDGVQAVLNAQAQPVADRVLVDDTIALREYMSHTLEINPRWLGVAVVDSVGRTISQSPDVLAGDESWSHLAAVRSGTRHEVLGQLCILIATPLVDPRIGTIRALVSLEEDLEHAHSMVWSVGTVLVLLTLAGMIAAWLMGGWVSAPLEIMARQVRRIEAGDLGATIELPQAADELSVLANALNSMSAGLATARERELEQQRQMVQVERLAAVGTFAAGAAHEVANPLAGVAGCVRRLARDDLDSERRERFSKLALDGLHRSSSVLQALLAYAKAEPRPAEYVSLYWLINSAVELTRTDRAIPVLIDTNEDLDILAPENQVEQIVTNLLLNAMQAAESQVIITWKPAPDGLYIDVLDDGHGILPEHLDRVFEPFFSTREPGEGTGLGLAVSRSIAQALGGDIILSSPIESGRGTMARLVLPVTVISKDSHAS